MTWGLIAPGDVVRWDVVTQGVFTGVVESVGTEADSLRIDALMQREPGSSYREFGPIVRVRCARATCWCTTGRPVTTPGATMDSAPRADWTHSVNECQLRMAIADGMLW